MKVKLTDIARVRSGVFATPTAEGEIVYLQSQHINAWGLLRTDLHPDLKFDNSIARHILKTGDVLIQAKGRRNLAISFSTSIQPAVASTSFFVIRIENVSTGIILPEFLTWFLNHPITQKKIKSEAIGTSLVSISKSVLEKLEIPIPDMPTQKAILAISQLQNKSRTLREQIDTLRDNIIQQQIINALN